MNRRSPVIRFLALLCLAALCSAQALGVARGYLCACSGEKMWTSLDHCHGPHHDDCHRETAAPSHDENGAGERKDHDQLREDVQWVQAPGVAAPAMMPVILAVLPELNFVSLQAAVARVANQWRDVGGEPPPSVAIARTVVLLI